MDEQQELSLEVERIRKGPLETGKQILHHIGQQTPIVWCGGVGVRGGCHDVTICLVPNGVNWSMGDEIVEHYRDILAVLKVHASRLRKCSRYFETCLSERCPRPCSTFILETNTDVACYTDCFSRMYAPPFRKDFEDVKYGLALLKVASQIQFHELMDSISLYISSKLWSDTDEMMIRLYSTSPDFPRNHAQDLIDRLGMDESKEDCHKQLCEVIEQCIRTALGPDGNLLPHRAFFQEMLPDDALSNGPSAEAYITRDVVMIVSAEAKDMLVAVAKECDGQTYVSVRGFADKILTICWILEVLLAAKVAEEVVQCFVHLHVFSIILAIDSLPPPVFSRDGRQMHRAEYVESTEVQREARNAAVKLAKLVIVMYQEVAAGTLLLKTPERVALLDNWHSLLGKLSETDDFDQAAKDLFLTLPLKQQMELVKSRKDSNYENYISTSSLAKLLKEKWPAMDMKFAVSPTSSSQLDVAIVSDIQG